jgi:23S rRNA pseudouridine1911/1915/1917 synthase
VVFVNGRRVWMAHHRLRQGDKVESRAPTEPARHRLMVLFEDSDYLVIDKPPGVLSTGPDSAERLAGLPKGVMAVHRLDRETSGCLLLAKNDRARKAAVEVFRKRDVTKTYHAIVTGQVKTNEETIREPVDGQAARTSLRVLDRQPMASHIQLKIDTGRTHQIRKHMALLRHPVAGDKRYGGSTRQDKALMEIPRQMLHARSLRFKHPRTGKPVRVEAALPRDFRACLRKLGLR